MGAHLNCISPLTRVALAEEDSAFCGVRPVRQGCTGHKNYILHSLLLLPSFAAVTPDHVPMESGCVTFPTTTASELPVDFVLPQRPGVKDLICSTESGKGRVQDPRKFSPCALQRRKLRPGRGQAPGWSDSSLGGTL